MQPELRGLCMEEIECPCCQETICVVQRVKLGWDNEGSWGVSGFSCPKCDKVAIYTFTDSERTLLTNYCMGSVRIIDSPVTTGRDTEDPLDTHLTKAYAVIQDRRGHKGAEKAQA